VVGGHRGRAYRRAFSALADQVTLTAICDRNEAVLAEWERDHPKVQRFARYEDLLSSDACDAVFLATPIQIHFEQSVAALSAGKHVLVEVVAATTVEECWALIEAVEKSGRTYMMAENYCYTRPNMLVRHLVERGLFGRRTYAEGGYIHDTRMLLFTPSGELTWRGQIARDFNGNTYPTHSLGPVAQWLGCSGVSGTAPEDRFVELVCYATPETSRWRYAADRFGSEHRAAQPGFFKMGDSSSTLLRTEGGTVVHLRRDAASQRPHNMTHYQLQGERASYLSPRYGGEDPLVWIDGRSPGERIGREQWQSLWDYAEEMEHPRWKERGAVAREAGHGGGDYFIVEDFVRAAVGGEKPAIDVYDAVTWSSVFPLSFESVERGGQPVVVPDFRKRR
jgi:predicted dehydrogenase